MNKIWNSLGLAVLGIALLVGAAMAEEITLTGNVDAVVDISTDPSYATAFTLNPASSMPELAEDSMTVKSTDNWKVEVSDEDTTNTAGKMTKYSSAAYVTSTKLATGLVLDWLSGGSIGSGSGAVLPTDGTGNILVTGGATGSSGTDVGFRYKQASSYDDDRLTGTDVYRIVVTFTASNTA